MAGANLGSLGGWRVALRIRETHRLDQQGSRDVNRAPFQIYPFAGQGLSQARPRFSGGAAGTPLAIPSHASALPEMAPVPGSRWVLCA